MTASAALQRALALSALSLAFALPAIASDFWLLNVLGQAFSLGLIALSLNFLAGYGGFVSLAQMTLAGCAGYTLALTSVNAVGMGTPLHPCLSVSLALLSSTSAGALVGWISARSNGIYLLMLTLALGMGFYFFVQQNVEIFNAFDGIRGIVVPQPFGVSLRSASVFYWLSLGLALAALVAVTLIRRSLFGLVLEAIRDHPRKAAALGFNGFRHRIAAFAFAGLLAGIGGVLYTWFNERISASTVGLGMLNAVLIMSVVGGLRRPIGAFVGALIYVLLQCFAANWVGAERLNTLVGITFVLIVLLSPDGVVGWVQSWRSMQAARKRAL